MSGWLPVMLLVYFILFLGVAFVWKTIITARKIKKSPLVLPKDDSAYGLIGFYFKLILIALFLYVSVYAIFPKLYFSFLPFNVLHNRWVIYAGLCLLLISFIWTVAAQQQMQDSWRIGIDHETPTVLVTDGLFAISRNPVFLGMITSLLGLFLVTPNAITLLFLVVGYVLIQVQIRLEEEFLQKQHGTTYIEYRQKTKRLI